MIDKTGFRVPNSIQKTVNSIGSTAQNVGKNIQNNVAKLGLREDTFSELPGVIKANSFNDGKISPQILQGPDLQGVTADLESGIISRNGEQVGKLPSNLEERGAAVQRLLDYQQRYNQAVQKFGQLDKSQ